MSIFAFFNANYSPEKFVSSDDNCDSQQFSDKH